MINQGNYEEMQRVTNNIKIEELYYFQSASWTVLFENILLPMGGKKIKVMWRKYHGARGDNQILFDS